MAAQAAFRAQTGTQTPFYKYIHGTNVYEAPTLIHAQGNEHKPDTVRTLMEVPTI